MQTAVPTCPRHAGVPCKPKLNGGHYSRCERCESQRTESKLKSSSVCNINGCNKPVSVSADGKSLKQCDQHGFRGDYRKASKEPKPPKPANENKERVYTMRIGHQTFRSTNATALLLSLERQQSSMQDRVEFLKEMEDFIDDSKADFKYEFRKLADRKRIRTPHLELYEQICGEKFVSGQFYQKFRQ